MSVFSIPRVNVIESDSGFSVEALPGRAGGLRYVESGRSLRIDSEIELGPTGRAIWTSSIEKWDPPHSNEHIDEATKARIVENVKAAFRFRGFQISVME